ncbi:hypothetical protein JMJ77_0008741 [Colletotrichum scovillei]|uniref:Uncharacterized protein n=1 Tax=Colletotrichum scovillei TaxID=1209932 RepID=A0A9P7U3U8_9PEZI|nr:hypothetical protein JMJ78_0001596 [Colletotrichum scovillei]KAG7041036.1 hypothetical protein JMJ77_0008741 [Colletotrichum scovillei]KAG7061069.1 hypothetical protein JMJ76_0010139 [Colletotrichum scovillei]
MEGVPYGCFLVQSPTSTLDNRTFVFSSTEACVIDMCHCYCPVSASSDFRLRMHLHLLVVLEGIFGMNVDYSPPQSDRVAGCHN